MSQTIQSAAETVLAEVEKVTAVILPEPGTAIVPLTEADPAKADEIRKRMAEIDMGNTQSIISFGSAAQAELQVISQEMLSGVKNKDVGPAGDSLREIVSTIRANSEDVGERFPEEARKIHYGEAEARGIRGEATREEASALIEEGVPVMALPSFPDEAN